MKRDDPRGPFLGQHTDCCQHVDGPASSSAWHGQEDPKGGFFVVENASGDVVAESWVWLSDDNNLCFDNIEGKGIKAREKAVTAIYQQAARDLSKKHHRITVGTGYSGMALEQSPGLLPSNGWRFPPTIQDTQTRAIKEVIVDNPAGKSAETEPANSAKLIARGLNTTDLDVLQRNRPRTLSCRMAVHYFRCRHARIGG